MDRKQEKRKITIDSAVTYNEDRAYSRHTLFLYPSEKAKASTVGLAIIISQQDIIHIS